MSARVFGSYDGTDILEVTLRSKAGAEAKIITWGAALRDLTVPSRAGSQRVVLGFEEFEPYVQHSPHFGANAGRFANRIANGSFNIGSLAYDLDRKPGSPHTLHGGTHGFSKRPWTLAAHDACSATLVLVSPDGDMGFPGTVVATCTYTLAEPATLRVAFSATTDKPTPVNLAHHSYFNLDGSPDILDHDMKLAADFYTPTDDELIPTGEIRAVAGTPYDFRHARPIRLTVDGGLARYDTNFVLRHQRGLLGPAATVRSGMSGVTLDVWTTEPGVQFYDAAKLDVPVPGLGGANYGPNAGFCLEAQNFPDAPNRPHFPDPILQPGEVYRQRTDYRFS